MYRGETKRAVLPNEVSFIDTVKALFVRFDHHDYDYDHGRDHHNDHHEIHHDDDNHDVDDGESVCPV